MTLVYAHIHDETLKEEFAKLDHKIVNIAGTVIEDRTVLDENDLQWFKQHVHAHNLRFAIALSNCEISSLARRKLPTARKLRMPLMLR